MKERLKKRVVRWQPDREVLSRAGRLLLYGFGGSFCGMIGDLCFSIIKRQTGIKDYGNLIPGHGGVLDRMDSMVMVAPLVEALMLLMPLVV